MGLKKIINTMFFIFIMLGMAQIAFGNEEVSFNDPTCPYEGAYLNASNSDKLTLFMIYVGENKKFTLINNQYLHVGESIQQYLVIDILPNEVLLQKDKQILHLKLFPNNILNPVEGRENSNKRTT